MVAGGDERARDPQMAGDFEVVERVAHEENFGGREAEPADEFTPEREFRVRVNVIETGNVIEVRRESEVRDDLVEGCVAIGGEDRLAEPGGVDSREHRGGVGMELGFEATRIVARDEFRAKFFKTIARRIEAEPFIVSAHGKIEERVVATAIEQGQGATGEHGVHHVDAEIQIVEERAVPIPDDVAIRSAGHTEKTLWTAACGPRNLHLMSVAPSPAARRWKCVCAYDGAAFSGWQCQEDGKGIQDVIQARLAQILQAKVRIEASGRTDAGVHARAQVFHFDAEWRHGTDKLCAALSSCLPDAIQIISVRPAAADFHARFSAKGKRYVYHLHLGDTDPFKRPYCWMLFRPIDLVAMRAAAALLVGKKDFRAFSAFNGFEREDTVRHVRRLDLVRRGKNIRVICEGDGFLYKMVRSLVGALVKVGEGRASLDDVRAILASRKRTEAVYTAPPQGLFLERVFYR